MSSFQFVYNFSTVNATQQMLSLQDCASKKSRSSSDVCLNFIPRVYVIFYLHDLTIQAYCVVENTALHVGRPDTVYTSMSRANGRKRTPYRLAKTDNFDSAMSPPHIYLYIFLHQMDSCNSSQLCSKTLNLDFSFSRKKKKKLTILSSLGNLVSIIVLSCVESRKF